MRSDSPAQGADFSWNPLIPIADDAHARALVRGGVWAAGLRLARAIALRRAAPAA